MKLLLLGDSSPIRQTLKKLFGKPGHQLDLCTQESEPPHSSLNNYDMVLVDGDACDDAQIRHLLELAARIRNRSPGTPILVLTLLDGERAAHGRVGHSRRCCGVVQTADGVWQVRCCLRNLAWNETAALFRDRCERASEEPVTFVYQG